MSAKCVGPTGPRDSTVGDFWRMVWQEQITQIIMLTSLIEDGKVGWQPLYNQNHWYYITNFYWSLYILGRVVYHCVCLCVCESERFLCHAYFLKSYDYRASVSSTGQPGTGQRRTVLWQSRVQTSNAGPTSSSELLLSRLVVYVCDISSPFSIICSSHFCVYLKRLKICILPR